jgi:hypothetical protein
VGVPAQTEIDSEAGVAGFSTGWSNFRFGSRSEASESSRTWSEDGYSTPKGGLGRGHGQDRHEQSDSEVTRVEFDAGLEGLFS